MQNFFDSALLQPARSVCVSERFKKNFCIMFVSGVSNISVNHYSSVNFVFVDSTVFKHALMSVSAVIHGC